MIKLVLNSFLYMLFMKRIKKDLNAKKDLIIMERVEEFLEEIKNMRKDFQEVKLLQLKLIEYMMPKTKPTKRERTLIRNISKMKFYSLEEVKKKLGI